MNDALSSSSSSSSSPPPLLSVQEAMALPRALVAAASSSSSSSSSSAPPDAQVSGLAVRVSGWVRSVRTQGAVTFVVINDGTTLHGVQVIVDGAPPRVLAHLSLGASVVACGRLTLHPAAAPPVGQHYEVRADATATATAGDAAFAGIRVLGDCDATAYPLQKKRTSLERLRTVPHVRLRTDTFASMLRVRSAATHAVHAHFRANGFSLVHTPVITGLDCEGGGDMFSVAADAANDGGGGGGGGGDAVVEDGVEPVTIAASESNGGFFGRPAALTVSGQLYGELAAASVRRVYTFGPTFRAEQSHTTRHLAEFWMLEPEIAFARLPQLLVSAESLVTDVITDILADCDAEVDYFDKAAAREAAQAAKGGGGGNKKKKKAPTTAAAAAEAPATEKVDDGLCASLHRYCDIPFARVTYTSALRLINAHAAANRSAFSHKKTRQVWGVDLRTEHERWLADECFRRPVFVTHYPASLKPFYMRPSDDDDDDDGDGVGDGAAADVDLIMSDDRGDGQAAATEIVVAATVFDCGDGLHHSTADAADLAAAAAHGVDVSTVACFDLLVPGIGELIGGSEREERYDVLLQSMLDKGVVNESDVVVVVEGDVDNGGARRLSPTHTFAWYADLRRFGSVRHGGYGLGFERLLQLVTRMKNIRDTALVPRYPGDIQM
jgi:asparaginyl-tRNA synthetase